MKKFGLVWERNWPWVLGAAFASAFYFLMPKYQAPDTAKDLLVSVISIGAISVGFLATMKAVLFSIDKRRLIVQMKDTKYWDYLIDYLVSGIRWASILSVVSAVGLLFDLHNHPRLYHLSIAVWIFIVVTAIGAYWRIVSLFATILRSD
jgi:hypothetical protein